MLPTVLHVDDVPALRKLVRMVLEDAGYPVRQVSDVPAALAILRSCGEPLVVLFTPSVPPGGLRLLWAVQDEPALRRHAFILLTAYPEGLSAAWHDQLSALAVPVLGKPFALDDLLAVVAAAAARLPGQSGPSRDGQPLAHEAALPRHAAGIGARRAASDGWSGRASHPSHPLAASAPPGG